MTVCSRKLCLCLLTIAWLVPVICSSVASAQVLSGQWVTLQDERIEKYRKSNLRVIVLDAQGKSVAGAQIHVAMQRHDFDFGVRLVPSRFAEPEVSPLPESEKQLWRLLSSVSIEEAAEWNIIEPKQGELDWTRTQRMLHWAAEQQLSVHWGEVVSADVSHLPVWLTELDDDALATALDEHITQLSARLAGRAETWDIITRLPDQDYLEKRLGTAITRKLLWMAQMHSPATGRNIRFHDTLGGPRLTQMVQKLSELRDQQAPVNGVTMDIKLGGNVAYVSLERSMEWLSNMNFPLKVMNLEVGGPSPHAAAINLETALRTFFAQPQVKGIYLDGLGTDQVLDPSSALIDEQGRLTPAGDLFVKLVGTRWWTDEIVQADDLGNARLRVFAGAYKIQAAWPGGQAATAAYITPGDRTQLIIVQQLGSK